MKDLDDRSLILKLTIIGLVIATIAAMALTATETVAGAITITGAAVKVILIQGSCLFLYYLLKTARLWFITGSERNERRQGILEQFPTVIVVLMLVCLTGAFYWYSRTL